MAYGIHPGGEKRSHYSVLFKMMLTVDWVFDIESVFLYCCVILCCSLCKFWKKMSLPGTTSWPSVSTRFGLQWTVRSEMAIPPGLIIHDTRITGMNAVAPSVNGPLHWTFPAIRTV